MNIPQGPWYIDDLLTFTVITTVFSTGVATDADAVPAYRVYEDETTSPILTGNMALLDSANTAGLYSEQITLSAANGFEAGKTYSIHVAATVSSVAGASSGGFKVIGVLATPTNITAGTITTVTNLTNAPTNGDLTATMKTSVTTAATAATPIAASVTGAVGSVTGNVGGNVTGSVGSVVGAVGSVTGAVGSVTGNVGGNVTGSVGSVVGAVGSVTGNVGGNVTGSVGSVVGAVGSVTGNVGGNVVGSVGSVVGAVGSVAAAVTITPTLASVGLTTDGVTKIAGVDLQLAGTGGQLIGG